MVFSDVKDKESFLRFIDEMEAWLKLRNAFIIRLFVSQAIILGINYNGISYNHFPIITLAGLNVLIGMIAPHNDNQKRKGRNMLVHIGVIIYVISNQTITIHIVLNAIASITPFNAAQTIQRI